MDSKNFYTTKRRLVDYSVSEIMININYDRMGNILTIVTKDMLTKEHRIREIQNPKRIAYIRKPYLASDTYYRETENIRNLTEVYLDSHFYEYNVARALGGSTHRLLQCREIKASEVYLDTSLFGADVDIEALYIMDYMDQHHIMNNDDIVPLEGVITKGYADIEIDSIKYKEIPVGKIHEYAENVPVNAISYLNHDEKIMYVYALRNKEYRGVEDCETHTDKFIERVKQNTVDAINKEAKNKDIRELLLKNFKDVEFKVKFYDFDYELFCDYMEQVYRIDKINILYFYNAAFDIQFMENRFNFEAAYDKWMHPDFKNKIMNFFYKDRGFVKMKDRKHDYFTSSYTKVVDQGIMFLSSRPQTTLPNESLNQVVDYVTGLHKLSYSHICDNMLDLVRLDFKTFLEYNIRDVLAQYFVELVVNDTDTMYRNLFLFKTPFKNVNGSIPVIDNIFFHDARRNWEITGCQVNKTLMKKFAPEKAKIVAKLVKTYIKENNKKPSKDREKEMDLLAGRMLADPMFTPGHIPRDFQLEHYGNLHSPKAKGGVVGDPLKLSLQGKELLPRHYSRVLYGVAADWDGKAHYPTALAHSNLSRTALYGRVTMFDGKRVELNDTETEVNGYFVDGDVAEIGLLFGLPSLTDIMTDTEDVPKEKGTTRTLEVNKENIKHIVNMNNIFKNLNQDKADVSDLKGKYTLKDNKVYVYSGGHLLVGYLKDKFPIDNVVIDGLDFNRFINTHKRFISKLGDRKTIDFLINQEEFDIKIDYDYDEEGIIEQTDLIELLLNNRLVNIDVTLPIIKLYKGVKQTLTYKYSSKDSVLCLILDDANITLYTTIKII